VGAGRRRGANPLARLCCFVAVCRCWPGKATGATDSAHALPFAPLTTGATAQCTAT
jgi:hypothetical protein